MILEPFLCLDSVEIGNQARTLAYLKAGLAGSEVVGFPDGGCTAYSDAPYANPAADPAPWYQAGRPESAEFLGTFLVLELQPVSSRQVSAQAPRGAALSPQQLRQRVLSATGSMYAASARGMQWGERWLGAALGGDCGDLAVATILPACPPPGDETRYFRSLANVGLVDGPLFPQAVQANSCVVQGVAFQLAAEIPELLAPPVTLAAGVGSRSAEVSVGAWLGDAAVRIVIDPSTALANWVIKAVPMAAGQSCPATGADPCLLYRLPSLPAGHRFVIDASVREVSEFDITAKRWVSGFGRLDFDGIFDWPEFPPCSNNCVSVVAGSGTATVTIEQIDREL